jgi:hypothetical protein
MDRKLSMGNRNNSTKGPAQHPVNMVRRINMDSSNTGSSNMGSSSKEDQVQDPVNTAHSLNMVNSNSKRMDNKETNTAQLVHTAPELQQISIHPLHQARPRANTKRRRMDNKAINSAGLAHMVVEHHQTSSHLLHQDKPQASNMVSKALMEVRRNLGSSRMARMMLNRDIRVGTMGSSSIRPTHRRISRVVRMLTDRRVTVKRLQILGGDESVAQDAC